MSQDGAPHDTNNLEEAEEAFIDLEDPNLEILDDGEDYNAAQSRSADEEGSAPRDPAAEDSENEEEDADNGSPQQDAEMEDLNAMPDREPERDDAAVTFSAPGGKPIHALALHPKNSRIFAASGEGEEVYILEVPEDLGHTADASTTSGFTLLYTLKGHTDTISLLSFSPNGEWLATGSLDSTVGLWSTSTWERVHSLTDLYGEIMSLLWHPSSLVLVAGADDAQAAMWNVAKGTLAMYFVGHRGPVTCCVWSPDHKKLVTGSTDGTVGIYNPKTGEQEVNVTKDLSPDNAGVTVLTFVNADQFVAGCEDGTMHVLSLKAGKVVSHFDELHEQAVESLQMNKAGTLLLSASCDCRVIVWNVADFSPRTVLEVGESVIPACWAGEYLVAAGCSDGDVRVWDGRSTVQEPLDDFMGHRRMILRLAVSDSGAGAPIVCSGGDDGLVKCFQLPVVDAGP